MPSKQLNFDSAKSGLTVALGVYPVFIGLYVVGFFWDVPKDALGGFTFSDFAFKASILYASFAAFIVSYSLAVSSTFVIFSSGISSETLTYRAENERDWHKHTPSDKIRHVAVSIALLALYLYSLIVDAPNIRIDPALFEDVLFSLFLTGLIVKPLLTYVQLKFSLALFLFGFVIITPIYAGFSDAEIEPDSPMVEVGNQKCPLIILGSENAIARCGRGYALIRKERLPTFWYWNDRRR